jgi:hypothetical protein
VREPIAKNADGTQVARVEVSGCTGGLFEWDPTPKKDVWRFRALCAGLLPTDLAPAGGVDAVDLPAPDDGGTSGEQYLVITTGPLAGAYAEHDATIDGWRIATLRWLRRGDDAMLVYCAAHRVPGRTFMPEDAFSRRCKSTLEMRAGTSFATFDPPRPSSDSDCGWRWKARATRRRALLGETPVERSFTCVYDASTAQLAWRSGK